MNGDYLISMAIHPVSKLPVHIGGSNFAFADGSVRFVRSVPSDTPTGYSADGVIFQAMGTRANGEVPLPLE